MAQTVKTLPAMGETRVQSVDQEDPLKKGMATHASILAWRTPWTEEPGGLSDFCLVFLFNCVYWFAGLIILYHWYICTYLWNLNNLNYYIFVLGACQSLFFMEICLSSCVFFFFVWNMQLLFVYESRSSHLESHLHSSHLPYSFLIDGINEAIFRAAMRRQT